MTYVITEPCIDVKDEACAGECPVTGICEGERVLCIRSGACVDCDAGEPACPVEAICCEHGVPGQSWPATRVRSTPSTRVPSRPEISRERSRSWG
jgi:Fe-S-cluster-containing hydrogenase component 2